MWFFNRFIRENRLNRRLLSHRYAGYRWMTYFLKEMVPYCTVGEGHTIIQVGAAAATIPRGVSQVMIYAALVGPRGHVFAIEPDPVNLSELITYIRKHKISNVTLIDKAAWNEKGTKIFTYRLAQSSANVQSEFFRKVGKDPLEIVQERETEVDTIANITGDYKIGTVNHVNVTVNGTEYEAIQGIAESLPNVGSISFAYQTEQTLNSPILEHLESQGFDIVVKHAPVSVKARQFLVGLATRKKDGVVHAMCQAGYDAKFEYIPRQHRSPTDPYDLVSVKPNE